jgi:AbrB family looped-hinge helix DNA binding protein
MNIIVKTAKISSKGQITLPKEVRDKLQSDTVCIVITDDGIRLEPVRDVGGSLKKYASETITVEEARDRAWTEMVNAKHPRR